MYLIKSKNTNPSCTFVAGFYLRKNSTWNVLPDLCHVQIMTCRKGRPIRSLNSTRTWNYGSYGSFDLIGGLRMSERLECRLTPMLFTMDSLFLPVISTYTPMIVIDSIDVKSSHWKPTKQKSTKQDWLTQHRITPLLPFDGSVNTWLQSHQQYTVLIISSQINCILQGSATGFYQSVTYSKGRAIFFATI